MTSVSRTLLLLCVPLALALVAPLAGGVLEGETELARRVMRHAAPAWLDAAPATDGVVLWSDWLPLPAAISPAGLGADHGIQLALWLALIAAVFALGRGLGLGSFGAAVAASVVAVHPVGVAAWADIAARGPLLATLALVAATAASLRPRLWPVAGVVVALGLLAHPLAALAPILTVLLVWARRRQSHPVPWAALGAQAVVIAAWMLAHRFIDASGVAAADNLLARGGDVPILAGLGLVARGFGIAVFGAPLVRRPFDVDWEALSATSPLVIAGAALLLVAPVVARLVRRSDVAASVWWAWAILLALSQLADPLPSAQAPGMLVAVLIGPALLLGALVGERVPAAAVVGIGCLVLALGPTRASVAWFESEEALLQHELAVAPGPGTRAALADHLASKGDAGRALTVAGEGTEPEIVAVRVRAHLALRQWGSARALLRHATGDEALRLACHVAVASDSVEAVRRCQAAREELGDEPELIASLARALDRDRRGGEAEKLLIAALEARPHQAVLVLALVDLYERAGGMPEAVERLEAWFAHEPGNPIARLRLLKALERKGRGDLDLGRKEDSAATLERALELSPQSHGLRYYLAEAYDALGRHDAARAQRQQARDTGTEDPRAVAEDQMRQRATRRPGLPSHDHDHDGRPPSPLRRPPAPRGAAP